jgi:membrane fusion protein (multidrug efflux system)
MIEAVTSRQGVRFHFLSAAILLAALLGACGKPAPPAMPPMEVAVLEVQPRDIPIYLDMIGQTRGSVDIPIRARIDGVLEEINFLEGRDVKKGQLLYVIDPTPFEAQVVEAEGRLAEATTQLAKASSDLDRIRPLAEMDAVSRQDLDAAVAQFKAAEGLLQAARAQVQQANIQLGYTRLMAPVDGLIGITQAKVGEYVGQSPNPVVLNTVSQVDPIRVRFSINESEYLRLRRDFKKQIRSEDEAPETSELQLILSDGSIHDHVGRVAGLDAAINPTTGTLTLEADFPNPERIVLPGQFARVRAVIDARKAALAVPQRAVMETQGIFQLAVVADDGKVELRQVQMGPRVNEDWIVESGLEPGELVVLEGLQRMRSGLMVVPKKAPQGSPQR